MMKIKIFPRKQLRNQSLHPTIPKPSHGAKASEAFGLPIFQWWWWWFSSTDGDDGDGDDDFPVVVVMMMIVLLADGCWFSSTDDSDGDDDGCWWQYWWASFVRGCECHRRQSINFWIIIIIILVFLFVLLFLIILQNVVSLLNCFSCTCSLVLLHGRKNDCGRLYYRAPLRSSGPLTSGKQGRTQKSIKSMESTKKQNLTSYTFRTMLPNFSVFS